MDIVQLAKSFHDFEVNNKLFKLNYYYLDGKRSKNNKVNFLNYNKKKYNNFIYKNLIFKKHIHSSKIIREKIFGDND